MQFTFNPTVSINVTGDLTIPDLAPGSYADSNIITVTAGSNDAHGYKLYGTVGSSSSSYTDLRITPSDSTNKFTNLSSNKATLANFSDNTWGYSYSTDSGSSWVSGNVGSTSSGYNGLPLYNSSNNASGVILASTSSASETSLQFKIGAKAASTQVSGTYTNTINFIGVGNVITTNYTINYSGNDADTGTVPTAQSGSTTDGVITLSETTPTRDGYIFKGWCDTDNSSDPTTCTGNTYNPGRIYIIPAASQGGTVTVNMYAIWKSIEETPAGETWYFNETVSSAFMCGGGDHYYVNSIVNSNTYNQITSCYERGGVALFYSSSNDTLLVFSTIDLDGAPGWIDQSYRTITISGGDDFDNADFRTWLSANATQL
ncbi:InlB B-repeat-containing protein [Candidatus Saccharibacteria bacterium]|nr:InlB B-repeat-containing protein [Candidatus Saccharibacteria bacterium]